MTIYLIIGGLMAAAYVFYKVYSKSHLDKNLAGLIKNGAQVLDVRTNLEYRQGHIEGAINIPLSSLRQEDLPLSKKQTYITCCSHGLRSVKAVQLLKERGFKHIYNGGVWKDLERQTNMKKM